jgi:hypothetical protein
VSRAEERAQVRQAAVSRVVGRILTTVPQLTEADAMATLDRAKALAGKPFRELDEYLAAHPDALATGDPQGPLALVRLAYVLAEAGHDGVKPPICARCGKATPKLPNVKPEGRVCGNCAANDHRDQCARCGQTRALIGTDRSGAPMCGTCSGAAIDYLCKECGQPGRPYARGRCDRCVMTARLRDLLADTNGVVPQQLQPVVCPPGHRLGPVGAVPGVQVQFIPGERILAVELVGALRVAGWGGCGWLRTRGTPPRARRRL